MKHQQKLHRLHRESGEERLAPIPSGSIKNGIRRLLHPAHHGGSGTIPGGALKKKTKKKSSTSELVGLSNGQERGYLWKTLAHQVTQSGMLTKLGLLKSGNLMN